MEISTDPYEQKLYHMFKSHDVESKGSLDKESLSKLCKTLELKERESYLMAALFKNHGNVRVTFKKFKEELLNLLGTDGEDTNPSNNSSDDDTLVSGQQSPSREVSPKFVVGGKKYGRRSRPQSASFDSQSDSDNEYLSQQEQKTMKSLKVQRSSSHSDIHGSKRRRPVTATKLKRCASLPSQKPKKDDKPQLHTQLESSVESLGNLDFENLSQILFNVWSEFGQHTNNCLNQSQLEIVCERVGLQKIGKKVAGEVFEKLGLSSNNRIGYNEFIALLHSDSDVPTLNQCPIVTSTNANSTGTLEDSSGYDLHIHTDKWPAESTAVPCTVIIDMWEAAGISNPKVLLTTLGFNTEEVHISQLSMAIDDDLQGDEDSSSTPLLKASLALHKAEVNALQQAFKQLAAENRKLHTSNRDANRQAALLAQEVDERHAHLENSAKTKILHLEQRHAEIVRDLTTKLAKDREHWTNLTSKLESRIKFLEQEEQKHRSDLISLRKCNSALETEQITLQNQMTDLLESNIQLNNDLADVEERQRNDDTNKSVEQSEQLLELMDKMADLQLENTNLRDKVDELSTELEERYLEIGKLKIKKSSGRIEILANEEITDSECSLNSATKRRGDSPSKAKISEESPRLGKLRKCNTDDTEPDSEGSGDWIALNSELSRAPTKKSSLTTTTTSGFSQEFSSLSDFKDEQIIQLKVKITDLESVLKSTSEDAKQNEDFIKLKNRNQELESSLELMRKEYEDCEDYWQGKLSEERQLYEEEQRISNEKLDDLLKKMSEYEEQFPAPMEKDGRLSPIEEKCQLEMQYAELEAETEEIKDLARQMLEEKSIEISDLKKKIRELHQRIGESFTPPPFNTDGDSPASSPINYLWQQSTIQAPARDYQNPNWNAKSIQPIQCSYPESERKTISPIQRPITPGSRNNDNQKENVSDASSVHSFTTHSIASTHSIHKSFPDAIVCSSPKDLHDEIKHLQIIEMQLKDGIQSLSQQRDSLVMELQQLQEVKPVLEKAYARSSHPSLMQRIQQLEMKNRHLQQCLKQQQHYTETIIHQTWQQQRSEITELCQRIEAQGNLIADQSHRLTNADLLVKDLYVENSQLNAAIQRLEQQRNRNSIMLQHQGLTGLPTP